MAGLNGGNAANTIKTALDKVFDATFDYPTMAGVATAENGKAFMQSSADNSAVIVEQFQGSGYWDSRTELQDVPEGSNKVGNQQTHQIINYAKSIDVSKNYFDDDMHDVVAMMVQNMARNARLTRDKNAFTAYNLGFTTETSNDSVALFSDSHVTLDGTTVDNLVSGALSDATLATAIVQLIEQLTQDGTLGGHDPAFLLVPPALWKNANIFAKSALRPTTANNDMNWVSDIYPGLQVLQSPFLGAAQGGSDTAWFLGSQNHSMYRWIRQAKQTDIVDYKYQRNNNYIYKGEYRETVAPIAYEGLVGSLGA